MLRDLGANVAGAVFVAAPYLSTDFRARFAYTEAVERARVEQEEMA